MAHTEVVSPRIAEKLAALASNLYSLPAVALKVLELVERPDVDAKALTECIEKDPALAAKILRVVNSSLYGPAQPVGNLAQALAFLGAKPLKLLVLGFSLPPKMFRGLEARVIAYYWRRSLTKAVAARELSEHLSQRSSDESFLSGLLQDLGLLLLIQALGAPFQRFIEKILEQREDLYRREREVFGFDHRDVSAALLSRWGMPANIAEAIRCPESEGQYHTAEIRIRRSLLEAAEIAARILAEGRHEMWASWQCHVHSLGDGFGGCDPEQLLRQIHAKVLQLGDVLSLRLPPGENVETILARAHNMLAQEAENAAATLWHPQRGSQSMQANTSPEDCELGRALCFYVEQLDSQTFSTSASPLGHVASKPSSTLLEIENPPDASPAGIVGQFPWGDTADNPRVMSPGGDPGFIGVVKNAVAWCRAHRCGLSLMLIDYCDPADLLVQLGPSALDKLQYDLMKACRDLDHPASFTWPYGDTGCAWILPDCERELAVTYAHELMRRLRSKFASRCNLPVRLRIGIAYVAAPSPHFPSENLITAAERCLFGSGASGGGVVKSIEIY